MEPDDLLSSRNAQPEKNAVKIVGSGVFWGYPKPSFLQHDSGQDVVDQW